MNKIIQGLPNEFDPKIIKELLKDRKALITATRQSFFLFFYVYFGRYIKNPIAPFHFEMFRIAQDENIKRAGVMTFRNSAKSTILNTAYSLWAIVGMPQKKHILIASQTQQRSKDHLMNIRKEIEVNELLRENLGPFREIDDRWHATILIITRYEARISAISIEEGIRGLKEGPNRPDLIIADDIEDSSSVKTKEQRNKTFDWFTGELIPLGSTDVKVIVLGNFLYKDSVLSRLEELINKQKMKGVFLKIPLVDENNKIAWPGRFTSMEKIEEFKQSIGNERTWLRDFLLIDIPDENQIILEEWIKEYSVMPEPEKDEHFKTFVSIDPAGSDNENSDYTAMVAASVFGWDKEMKVYINSNIINKRLRFNEIKDQAIFLSKALGKNYPAEIIVEDVGVQKWLIQELKNESIPVSEFKVAGTTKADRLNIASSLLQAGKVYFPKKGAEELKLQLTGFGREKHDDLADAFSMLILKIIQEDTGRPSPFPDQGNDPSCRPIFAGILDMEF